MIESRFEAESEAKFSKLSKILSIPTSMLSTSALNPPLASPREIRIGLPERVKVRQRRRKIWRKSNRWLTAHRDYMDQSFAERNRYDFSIGSEINGLSLDAELSLLVFYLT